MSLLVVVACAVIFSVPKAAFANSHTYCSSCGIGYGTYIQDWESFYLTGSYVHWLSSSGTRYLGVSASSDPNVHSGYNEVFYPYPGLLGAAQAFNLDVYSTVTVNAHADF